MSGRALGVVAIFGAMALAGCSNSDFISLASNEGIIVHHPDLARATVGDLWLFAVSSGLLSVRPCRRAWGW